MTDAKWYEDMAAAMKERDRALTGIARWEDSLAEAEAKIQALLGSNVQNKRHDERITDANGNFRNGDGTILEPGPELQARWLEEAPGVTE